MKLNILLAILLIIVIGMLYIYSDFSFKGESGTSGNELAFVHHEWMQGNERLRGRMTNHLLESDTLLNQHKNDVIDLLGNSDLNNDTLLIYNVDMGHSMSPSGEAWTYHLIMILDNTNTVKRVSLSD